jgi:hypothetical protein
MASCLSLVSAHLASPSPHSDGAAVVSQTIKILIKARMTVASCHYEFIKRYLTRVFARGAVDVTAKSVYVAARNLVFGLSLLLRSRLRAAPQVNSQNFGL